MVNWKLEIKGCKGILIRLGDCSLVLNLSLYNKSQGARILMLTL